MKPTRKLEWYILWRVQLDYYDQHLIYDTLVVKPGVARECVPFNVHTLKGTDKK